MNINYQTQKSSDNRLATQGGRFILRIHTNSQLLASIIGSLFGVFFIYITANLSQNQFIQFLVSMASAIVLVNIFHAIYIRMITKHARLHLDHLFKNLSLPDNSDELTAWDEIIALPRRSSIAQIVMVYFLIITPVILYMRWSAGINPTQIVSIVIGGSLSAMVALVQGFLFLDIQLKPARQALLPVDPSQQEIRISVGQRARQYFVTSILLLMAILTIGGIGYQNFLAAKAPGANQDAILFQYQNQLVVMGIAIFIVGTFLASRLAQSVSSPTEELIHVMESVKKGDYTERAQILTSDDMAQLTIHLNQMLNQLQTTETSMERVVIERTANLEQISKQLRAAAQVAREAASLQDLKILLSRTVNLISEQFGYYHAGIFLIDDSGEYVELQAASSEGGRRMLARGHRLAVGQQGIVGAAAYQNRPHIAKDVSADRTYFNNPDLPMTRSEAAIPLIAHGKVIGVLDIQSTEESEFETSDVGILQILADQISLAIQNARLFTESKDAIQRLQATTAENLRRVWRERVLGIKNAYRFTSAGLASGLLLEAQTSTNTPESNYLKIPITLRGQNIGSIVLHRRGDSTWSESDRSLAIEVSDQVGLALENARLLEEAQQHAAQEQSLSELSARLSRSLDPDALLQTTIRELHHLPNVSEISTSLIPPEKLPSGEAN